MSLTEDKREAVYQQIQSQKALLETELFQDGTANALEWARKYHLNSRRERMVFKKVPYLTSLYALIATDTQMVVEKSVQCFPYETQIVTPYGYQPIGELSKGDLVLTHTGKYRRVKRVFTRKHSGKMIEQRADLLPKITSTPGHSFLSFSYSRNKYHHTRYKAVFGKDPIWRDAKGMSRGDFVCRSKIPSSIGTVKSIDVLQYIDRPIISDDGEWFKEKWGQREFKKVIDLDYDFGILVGLYLSEGWINETRVCFGFHIDELHLEKLVYRQVERFYRGKDPLHTYVNAEDNCRRVFVCGYPLSEMFRFLFGEGCSEKSLPPDLLYTAPTGFLRGVFDGALLGDGCVNGTAQSSYRTVSDTLANQMRFLGAMFGKYGVIREEHAKGKRTVFSFVFSDPTNRKYTRLVDTGKYMASRIRKIRKIDYSRTVYNLEVGVDHSYVAEDYVVHNCGLSELFIISAHLEALRGLTVMYILPKYELRNRFVNNRVYKLHRHAPKYNELIRQGRAGGIHRTSMTHFGKGVIAYVGSNVESEFIEIPVDSIYVDEKDRCNLVNLELVPDRITASPYKYHREISNPTVEGFGIDERYQSSSQGMWNIKCEACGEYFVPDFFRHVVRQIGTRIWEPLDPEYNPEDEFQEIRLICQCGAPVDRLKDGEWIHKYTKRIWQGYRISKLFNKVATLRGLFDKWMDAQGNPTKTQIVYNSDLGLPFTAKGAKILEHELNACKRSYGIIRPEQATDRPRVMGIDVGADLHYIIRDLVMEQGVKCRRLLELGVVPTFKLLDEIVERWNPRIIVIDALPEIHKVQDFKTKHKNAWSSKFQQDQRKIAKNKNDRELSMDRTALLDYVQQSVNTETMLLPEEAEHLEHGEYYAHMKASTRILEIDQEKPDKSRFVWVHTMPDHFFLAEGYTFQGFLLLPNIEEVMGFFRSNTPRISTDGIEHIKGVSEEKRKELDRLARLTPDAVLTQMKKLHHGR